MIELFSAEVGGGALTVVATERVDGDVHLQRVPPDELVARQLATTGRRWAMVDQTHGVDVVDVRRAVGPDGERVTLGSADVLVGDRRGPPLAIWAADCAPVVLVGVTGTVVAVHAGWRGLAAGVLDVAVDALGDAEVVACVLGPVIHACCYEFGPELTRVASGVHAAPEALRATTRDGRPSLDVVAAVESALAHHRLRLDVVGPCTGCDERFYSHRIRREPQRHAVVAGWGPLAPPSRQTGPR